MSNIDSESYLLKEIKDICDELGMILRILKDQEMVLSTMTDVIESAVIESSRRDTETRRQYSPSVDGAAIETKDPQRTRNQLEIKKEPEL